MKNWHVCPDDFCPLGLVTHWRMMGMSVMTKSVTASVLQVNDQLTSEYFDHTIFDCFEAVQRFQVHSSKLNSYLSSLRMLKPFRTSHSHLPHHG